VGAQPLLYLLVVERGKTRWNRSFRERGSKKLSGFHGYHKRACALNVRPVGKLLNPLKSIAVLAKTVNGLPVASWLSRRATNRPEFAARIHVRRSETVCPGPQAEPQSDGRTRHSERSAGHRFHQRLVLDLPVGQGKRFLSGAHGFVQQILGGWSLSGNQPRTGIRSQSSPTRLSILRVQQLCRPAGHSGTGALVINVGIRTTSSIRLLRKDRSQRVLPRFHNQQYSSGCAPRAGSALRAGTPTMDRV